MDALFANILDMSLVGSLVIAVVLLARLGLKRMPKIFSYCLWAVVLLRLLSPVGIAVPVSAGMQMPSVSDSYSLADTEISFQNAGAAALDGFLYATNHNPDTHMVQIPQSGPALQPPQAPQVGDVAAVSCAPWEAWVLFGQYLWLAGVAVMVGISLVQWGKLRRKLAEAVLLRENIYMVDGIDTSFVMGLLRPKIYMPAPVSDSQRQHMLLHERHHIRRLDHIWKLLGFAALCLHWFNPLVWVAFFLAEQDMEMSCDEATVRKLNGQRADYSQTLLAFSGGCGRISGVYIAFGQKTAARRIRNLSHWKQPKRAVALLTALACGLLMVGCVVEPAETTPVEMVAPSAPEAQVLVDVDAKDYDYTKEIRFTMPEYPGVQFYSRASCVFVLEADGWRGVVAGMGSSVYLADLNGDGKREFCTTCSFGSGIISQYIEVYDYADDMSYALHKRMAYDFALGLENGQLVVYGYRYPSWGTSVKLDFQGKLALQDRVLTCTYDGGVLEGNRTSPLFNVKKLEDIMAVVKEYHEMGLYLTVMPDCLANDYMEYSGVDFSAALIREEIEGRERLWLDPDLTEGFEAEAQYLALLHRLTSTYYAHGLLYYVYQDPNDPAQLFICTEIRDCGYRDIASYYEAVMAGTCQPHTETFLVRLDQRAIYRWGSQENLYAIYE